MTMQDLKITNHRIQITNDTQLRRTRMINKVSFCNLNIVFCALFVICGLGFVLLNQILSF